MTYFFGHLALTALLFAVPSLFTLGIMTEEDMEFDRAWWWIPRGSGIVLLISLVGLIWS